MPGIRAYHRRRVELPLERGNQRVNGFDIRTRRSGRRHHAGAQLGDHLFGDVRLQWCAIHIEIDQGQVAPSIVRIVALFAVLLHDRIELVVPTDIPIVGRGRAAELAHGCGAVGAAA